MIAIGIDVSKGTSKVAVIGESKKVLQKPFDDVRVCMEHTEIYYQVVAETLSGAGLPVSVVNPVLINQYGDNSLRKVKPDKRDSMKIARYTLDNRDELRDYTKIDTLRDNLKSITRQFNFEDKTLTAYANRLYSLLERSFPHFDEFFISPAKPNGHQKFIDFVIEFWHSDCVSSLSLVKFTEKYRKVCKKNRYIFKAEDVAEIHAISRENVPNATETGENVTGCDCLFFVACITLSWVTLNFRRSLI